MSGLPAANETRKHFFFGSETEELELWLLLFNADCSGDMGEWGESVGPADPENSEALRQGSLALCRLGLAGYGGLSSPFHDALLFGRCPGASPPRFKISEHAGL
eukprot:gnl/TRDRNA2_/TRDRNA2_140695_c0_seq1.p3 gnl/TRDRNA2_/TRDRNA2_140695_c0~~gnl/TRDRNA2_/TRDRNA2_140695_c0_seq1.p3  ORF type:complete len:104 (+),score=11.60 gnl/TRDRNA2_/TRDRNA2_140695_c0_seq1:412-723(+)